ncbi:MAG: hypothetical protein IKG22_16400 [Atopobiaceae bacterium]|nr:hypothetical protein [Atopobiaceae bacterium]
MLEFEIDSWYLTDEGESDLVDSVGEVWLLDERCEAEPVVCVPKAKAPADTSDGWHTFDELYEHRTGLLAALCNVIAGTMAHIGLGSDVIRQRVFKSRRHHDGEMYDGMFIVGINCGEMPGPLNKLATWHCEDKWWDRFIIPEVERAPEWDGHTPQDALERLVRFFTTPEDEGVE